MNDAIKQRWPRIVPGTLVLVLMSSSGAVCAASIDLPNPDYRLRWDNTVRYTLGMRAEGQDQRIMRNPSYDESDGKFDRGDIVTNRVDLLSEIDFSYRKDWGARLSAAAWYDHAYRDDGVKSRVPGMDTSYDNNRYSAEVKRYVHGPSGEILDAFVWGNFRLGNALTNVKLGRHTNYWGEGLLFGAHAISYSQAPIDGVKAVTSPGIETKEVFLPIGQLSARAQVTDSLTLAGQYFYEWDYSRMPYGGTYFGVADPFFEGPDRLPVMPGFDLQRSSSRYGRDNANWGLMAKLNVEQIESSFGLYYRQFDDYQPWFAPQTRPFTVGDYRLVYPRDVKLMGLSFSRVFGSVAVGSELSYRKNGALNAAGVSELDDEGPRGDSIHFVTNAVYGIPRNFLAPSATLVGESAYSHLRRVTGHEELYLGKGRAACVDPRVGAPGSGGVADGCSTRDYYAVAVNLTPQYLSVMPSWDMSVPMTVNYGIKGNAATAGGGNEGALSWSVGVTMTYAQRFEFGLRYADTAAQSKTLPDGSVAGNGSVGGTDRGWLALTFKTSI
ncbi:DUF1302 family protein [Pseudomonas aeruginosa]|uniref:DUF1302 domain-containing protein n=1 Tax=Pseudomonas aeruginosa TaxID=287 RepID=UPI00106854A9|nr:DUF1302 family protein [Pseudomonas aeruginosa]TEL39896.1 DUF1302 family protein [Pseudomonas aeruginosa]TEL44268.1 DUF1302 family protein [Pseudomonas aeruginosa]TEN05759.1 DUF1302 family protein [Pseudomonas aeruginosa]TEN17234.1 DUF1302 family protein [Pseudomonas aeruginosa]TEN32201.1 DUF1302 family protein [Pseudomonas aeruginosa]